MADLSKIDLQKYKKFLKGINLIPSRKILQDDIDDKFSTFEKCGFHNLKELKQAISTSDKMAKLAKETGISQEYLNILRRELGVFDKTGEGLLQINGIGEQAATAFIAAGYKTVEDIAKAKADVLLEKITKVNAENNFYKANLGLNDMQFVIDYANLISGVGK